MNYEYTTPLQTVSMSQLYETVYHPKPPLIEGLLYPGTYLFVGAPKLGKSFFMAQIAYHISTGAPLWEYPVRQGDVLYLALEDDYRRLQDRLYRMFGTDCTEHLHLAVAAMRLGDGLHEQMQSFLLQYPNTSLIIIDTLQKVRAACSDTCSYANDYEVITTLKHFADAHGICLLLVHHTRKQQSDDRFDMISGTNGLLGAADGAFLLHKEKRIGCTAVLEISGRDQQDQKLHLNRNPDTLLWELDHADMETWHEQPDPVLIAVSKFITSANSEWIGAPTDLVNLLSLNMRPNTLSLKLNVNAGRLLNDYHILYESNRTHDGRRIHLRLLPKRVDGDGRDDLFEGAQKTVTVDTTDTGVSP